MGPNIGRVFQSNMAWFKLWNALEASTRIPQSGEVQFCKNKSCMAWMAASIPLPQSCTDAQYLPWWLSKQHSQSCNPGSHQCLWISHLGTCPIKPMHRYHPRGQSRPLGDNGVRQLLTSKVSNSISQFNTTVYDKLKHSRGKTSAVRQQYSLCRENFRGLPTIAYFRVCVQNFQW